MKFKVVKNLFLIFFLPNMNLAFSQITFERRYGNSDYEYGNYIESTFDGGYIIAGRGFNFPQGSGFPLLLKIDAAGDIVWVKSIYNYEGSFNTVHQLADSGFIAGGFTEHFTEAYFIARTNSLGDTLWTKTIMDSTYSQWCYSISPTADGGFISVTNVNPDTINDYDLLIRLDSYGDTIWTKRFHCMQPSRNEIYETTDHGFAMTGIKNTSPGHYEIFLARFDSTGDSLWTKFYEGYLPTGGNSAETSDGGFILCGQNTNNTTPNAFLIRTNANGDTLWTRKFGGTTIDWAIAKSVRQTDDGGFIFSGNIVEPGGLNFDLTNLYLVKVDSSGNEIWSREYDEVRFENGECVQQTGDGGYVVCGVTSNIFDDGIMDVYVVKTDEFGDVMTQATHVDKELKMELIPNPAHNKLTVSPIPAHAFQLEIYNAMAEIVYSRILRDSKNEIDLTLNIKPGIYILKVTAADRTYIKKLILN